MVSKRRGIFVAGIDTSVGKTVASAVLVKAFGADYWKPVQCGDLEQTDTSKVKAWSNRPASEFFAERFLLKAPQSPHWAAELEGCSIRLENFTLPPGSNSALLDGRPPLVVEGAGGVATPLNYRQTMADLALALGLPVVLVTRHYLGSLNHTLMSVEFLRRREIPLMGFIVRGAADSMSEKFLQVSTGLPLLFSMEQKTSLDAEIIEKWAKGVSTQSGCLAEYMSSKFQGFQGTQGTQGFQGVQGIQKAQRIQRSSMWKNC